MLKRNLLYVLLLFVSVSVVFYGLDSLFQHLTPKSNIEYASNLKTIPVEWERKIGKEMPTHIYQQGQDNLVFTRDNHLYVMDFKNGKALYNINCNLVPSKGVNEWSYNEGLLAVSYSDKVRIFDALTNKIVREIELSGAEVFQEIALFKSILVYQEAFTYDIVAVDISKGYEIWRVKGNSKNRVYTLMNFKNRCFMETASKAQEINLSNGEILFSFDRYVETTSGLVQNKWPKNNRMKEFFEYQNDEGFSEKTSGQVHNFSIKYDKAQIDFIQDQGQVIWTLIMPSEIDRAFVVGANTFVMTNSGDFIVLNLDQKKAIAIKHFGEFNSGYNGNLISWDNLIIVVSDEGSFTALNIDTFN